MDRDPFDLVGDVLDGQFRVVTFAGEGDLSVVYKGHHLGVDAPVAIKCLNLPTTLDGALVRPLVESFREASRLHYTLARGNLNIAQSIASGSTLAPATGMIVPYLVREWFEGESLASELARRREEGKKGRTVEEVLALLEPAVDALAYAHGQGAVHLSINPGNLFLSEKAGVRSLKVLDFGVARAMNELVHEIPPASRPKGGLRVLFPAYAAPEQLDATVGEPGAWTDVYALALLAMELLSDRVVMSGDATGTVVDRALDEHRRPTPRAHGLELPRNLDLVLTRAVARTPARRQRHARDFWNDVKASLRGNTSRGIAAARTPAPAVVGAVPGKRPPVPSTPSVETIPMGFQPVAPATTHAAARAPAPPPVPPVPPASPASPASPAPAPLPPQEAAQPTEPDLPPVHVVATPPPPQAAMPDLPPVIVAIDSPLAAPAPPIVVPPAPPPPVPPAPTFPIIEAAATPRRSRRVLVSIVAAVVGLSLGVIGVAVLKRHWTPEASAGAAPVPASSPMATPVESASPTPSASVAPSPATSSSASPAPVTSATPTEATAPPSAHFSPVLAKQALEATSHEVARCKRGKLWGISSANVTFNNDGTVSHVAVGVPFTGTPTGQCVSEALSAARMPPFAGKPAVVPYRFFVAAK